MKRRYKWIVTPLFVLLLLWAARGCAAPLWYSSPALEARVVDASTGQPMAGVIAVAHWELEGGLYHGRTTGQLVVLETVTNADGQFSFPAWGPKLRPFFGTLKLSSSPRLALFKSEYTVAHPPPEWSLSMDPAPRVLPLPHWHHTNIQMKKFEGSFEEYAKHLGFLDDTLRFAFQYDDCTWKQIPRILVALHLEEQRFKEQRIPTYRTPLLNREERAKWAEPSRCGSVKEFLRSYLP
jgi:hypothetical protein